MNDEHIHAFVSESRESITDLNNALLALEDDPSDEEAIESVFRTAHTLKGNFGAMGFSSASELAHVLEDLLDEIRDGEIEVTTDIMDAAFEGIDLIETIIDEIEAEGESNTDPTQTTERLRAALESGTAAAAASNKCTETADNEDSSTTSPGEENGEDVEFVAAESVPEFPEASSLLYAQIEVDPDGMLGVDAMLILEPLSKAFGDLSTAPARDSVEEGDYDAAFDVFIPNGTDEDLTRILGTIGAVESFETTTLRGTAESTPDEDAEMAADDGDAVKADNTGGGNETETAESDTTVDTKKNKTVEKKSASGSNISSVRVDVDRLDELHGLVEQLVTGRITIRRAIEEGDIETASTSLNDFDKVTSRLQNTVMDMRLIPLRRVVSNLPRVVRDVARSQNKEISFEMHGQDIELDRSILTEIEDPLIHILRNAVDHGVESPNEREAVGKPREGQIELHASRQRDHVTITVSDDGGGIDADAMRTKAVNEGVISEAEAETMSDDDAYDLIFHPGFSTADEVTDVSGRGVGMDVVHSTVEQLDGTVNVDSDLGEGTTVELRLPVSVAIVNILFVTVGKQEYGIPIKNIDELTHATDTETINGNTVVRHDDEVYPVIRLDEALEINSGAMPGGKKADTAQAESTESGVAADGGEPPRADKDDCADGMLVRIRETVRPVALQCDSFSDQEEVVVKPLEGSLSGIPGLSGTAILGDGNIVPILDVVSLQR